jgi:2'-5' RNA ligase
MHTSALIAHYNQMWIHARSSFLEGKPTGDPLLDEPGDDRYGITLLLRPDETTAQKIHAFLQQMAGLEPDQYYYPVSDLHLTILSIISCYSGFQLSQIDIPAYDTRIKEVLRGVPPFRIRFKGITASPSTVLIQGFPEDDALQRLRDQLRVAFKNSTLQHSIDSRYRLFTAHSTVIRFRKPLQNPSAFVNQLEKYRQTDFGLVTAKQVELVGNDWYQRKEKVKMLKTYRLEKTDEEE